MGERIGIFGGTFNPVHLGHLVLAQDAMEHFEMDRVVFVPCGRPPHKPAAPLAPAEHRAAMVDRAIEGNPLFALSRFEVDRPEVSYTIDTVRHFRAAMPSAEPCFVIGADTLPELHSWRAIGELLDLCAFAVVSRPGHALDPERPERLGLPGDWGRRLLAGAVVGHEIGISSTDVRMRLAEGLSVRYLVPDAVAMYIGEHHLYQD